MTTLNSNYNRRSFFKVSMAAGGGVIFGFNWLAGCTTDDRLNAPSEWFDLNAYIKIGDNGQVTIMSANPEIGQNVKTAMPMVVAEELDVSWDQVVVEQAPLSSSFIRQVAGGSQSLRASWQNLRQAGATARQMLINAAAQKWNVDPATCDTAEGQVFNDRGESIGYGDIATLAASMEVPVDVKFKNPRDFKIIGQSKTNVDMEPIITGKPLFGLDQKKEGMHYACVLRPPAFGQKLISFDDSAAQKVGGVSQVFQFGNNIAVIASNTWAAMKGKESIKAVYAVDTELESTEIHDASMLALLDQPAAEPKRMDGRIKQVFDGADQVITRTYEGPFLPHNCLEPMNFFAHVTDEKVELSGPIQTPERTQKRVAEAMGRDISEITIDMTRMGGGFGRRLNGDFVVDAAEISQRAKVPVMLVYTREDDMTAGIYRPATKYKFRAAIKNGKVAGYHLTGAGINSANVTREHNFPATAIANYLAESHELKSNITTGAWRAPITNFLAFAEQSFLDEVAEIIGQDPVQFRLDLLEQARNQPTGELHYDIDKFVGVIKLAAEKSNWGKLPEEVHQGFSAYYSHNTYVAEVANVIMKDGKPIVDKVVAVADCGIVVNPVGAINQMEGGVIDGIGHAMFGDFSFIDGKPKDNNFNTFRLIRMHESPTVEVHFVNSENDPTGLGEPSLPPAGGALANALYRATGERLYSQPFVRKLDLLG